LRNGLRQVKPEVTLKHKLALPRRAFARSEAANINGLGNPARLQPHFKHRTNCRDRIVVGDPTSRQMQLQSVDEATAAVHCARDQCTSRAIKFSDQAMLKPDEA